MRVAEPVRLRDDGRTATYAAEDAVFGGTDADGIVSLADLGRAADAITSGEWWQACGGPRVIVSAARSDAASSSARGRRGVSPVAVRLAAGQCTLCTLAHELAHALAGVRRGHDAVFRAAEVDLVALLVNADTASRLRGSFAEHGVPAGQRRWPLPVRMTGDGFAVVP